MFLRTVTFILWEDHLLLVTLRRKRGQVIGPTPLELHRMIALPSILLSPHGGVIDA
jgi:hypothetical protein